jgi:hypothetical protein
MQVDANQFYGSIVFGSISTAMLINDDGGEATCSNVPQAAQSTMIPPILTRSWNFREKI